MDDTNRHEPLKRELTTCGGDAGKKGGRSAPPNPDDLTLPHHRQDYYRWRNGRWEKPGKEEAEAEIMALLQESVDPAAITASLRRQTRACVDCRTLIDGAHGRAHARRPKRGAARFRCRGGRRC